MKTELDFAPGIALVGRYRAAGASYDPDVCWLLHHGDEAAIVDLPPFAPGEGAPYDHAREAAKERGVSVRYLLCTVLEEDHFHPETLRGFAATFPGAVPVLHRAFAKHVAEKTARFFGDDEIVTLSLGGEPLALVHAPKHAPTDTFVVFRGAAITGDWEFDTLRSVNDGGPSRVPVSVRRRSIDRLLRFAGNYQVNAVISSRANDVRRGVNFARLLGDTLLDRDLGWGGPVADAGD
jgi:hypothetical protein